jgi:hypothetical protein
MITLRRSVARVAFAAAGARKTDRNGVAVGRARAVLPAA